jgi:hypothetical protein
MILCLALATSSKSQHYLGTKTPYTAQGPAHTPAPAGYTPVFVNYVGRHGARFLTKAGADLSVGEALQAAAKSHSLTPAGQRILSVALALKEAGKGNYENITLLGKKEQEGIGMRLRREYGQVFAGRGLETMTTWKVRTQQSADAFLRAFEGYSGPRHATRAPDTLDTILRFYDLSVGYQRYKKNKNLVRTLDSLDKDGRTAAVAASVCARVFVKAYAGKLPAAEKIAFTESLYDLYAISFSMQEEARQRGVSGGQQGLGLAFGRKDLEWLDFTNGAADFLEKGPAFDSLGIQVRVAAPLLVDFINSTDRVLGGAGPAAGAGAASQRPDAILRFTHAEAIAPFAALLGIAGASEPVASVYRYQAHWRADSVIPLSANIQWIVYGRAEKDYLVKVLLNEKEAVLPLPTARWPYYRWEDLKKYYREKLGVLHAGLQDDMLRYLGGLN